jgi:cell division protein FtsN
VREHGLRLVVIGPFPSDGEARSVARELEAKGFSTAVRRVRDAVVAAPPIQVAAGTQPGNPYIVRIGSFRVARYADEAKRSASSVTKNVGVRRSGAFLLVEAGPFASRAEAGDVRQQLQRAGLDAVVIHN